MPITCAEGGNFHLYFNSTCYGEFVSALVIVPKLVEEVRERHNFWAPKALLDCAYPAIIWEYTVSLFILGDDRTELISKFATLTDIFTAGLKGLTLTKDESTTPLSIDCRTCCLADISGITQPEDFLMSPAGVFNLKFLGTEKPIITLSGTEVASV